MGKKARLRMNLMEASRISAGGVERFTEAYVGRHPPSGPSGIGAGRPNEDEFILPPVIPGERSSVAGTNTGCFALIVSERGKIHGSVSGRG